MIKIPEKPTDCPDEIAIEFLPRIARCVTSSEVPGDFIPCYECPLHGHGSCKSMFLYLLSKTLAGQADDNKYNEGFDDGYQEGYRAGLGDSDG